jgi:hypothetical protein
MIGLLNWQKYGTKRKDVNGATEEGFMKSI